MQNPQVLQMILDQQMAEVFQRQALTDHQQIETGFNL
jgi:hypothetical protein